MKLDAYQRIVRYKIIIQELSIKTKLFADTVDRFTIRITSCQDFHCRVS